MKFANKHFAEDIPKFGLLSTHFFPFWTPHFSFGIHILVGVFHA